MNSVDEEIQSYRDSTSDMDVCVLCGKKQISSSNLSEQVFKVNKCGHKYCIKCIDRESKRQFPCPVCKASVVKDKLSLKSLEDIFSEKDVIIRRKIRGIFNRTEEDFTSLQEFNDYEEMVENIIYNLVFDVNIPETNEKIKEYSIRNMQDIRIKQHKREEMIKDTISIIENEEKMIQSKNEDFHREFIEDQLKRKDQKRQINQIMLGEDDRSQILPTAMQPKVDDPSQLITLDKNMSAMHPVIAFLSQRLEPVPLKSIVNKEEMMMVPPKKKIKTKQDLLQVHRVGGYRYEDFHTKNCKEIETLFESIIK